MPVTIRDTYAMLFKAAPRTGVGRVTTQPYFDHQVTRRVVPSTRNTAACGNLDRSSETRYSIEACGMQKIAHLVEFPAHLSL